MNVKFLARAGACLGVLVVAACGSSGVSQGGRADETLTRIVVEDDPACPAPRCFEVLIPLPDDVSVTDNRVRIWLPKDYDASAKAYPVLYLLHDAPGDYLSWTREGRIAEALQDLPVIAIMPDGGGGNPGWYSDWRDGSYQWESYHMNVMLPYLERHLRVLGDGHRAVAGPSMGGFGAMSYAARYPGRFKAAAGFSGAVDFLHLDRVSALYAFLGNPIAGTPNGPIWGDPVTHFDIWQAHDPGTHVDGLRETQVLLTCGNGLPGGGHDDEADLPTYAIEPLLLLMNTSFEQTLANAGIAHEVWFYGPGYHDWPHYRDAFAWALPQLMAAISVQEF